MRQLFKVGELVVICSKIMPERNGEVAKILGVRDWGSWGNQGGLRGTTYQLNKQVRYTTWYDETSLRKYHPPSTKSFTEIMEELKGPVKA